jgi:hypothetical protein
MTRALSVRLCAALLAAVVVHGLSDDTPYTQVARLDRSVDGKGFNSFAYDPVDQRLYAGSWNGVFWMDLREREPRIKGPMLNKRIGTIEIAPDSGRLFYTSTDEFGYVNLRSNDPPRVLAGREWQIGRMAYEPTRREMYVGTREQGILVFDTETGERGPVIALPGWYPTTLEAVAGKVFVSLKDNQIATVTTNVPGPRETLYSFGRELLEILPYVPIADRVRIGVAIFSYRDALTFGITADYDAVPDVEVLADGIATSMAELVEAAG